jgi:Domain of unknown function (DUF4268)
MIRKPRFEDFKWKWLSISQFGVWIIGIVTAFLVQPPRNIAADAVPTAYVIHFVQFVVALVIGLVVVSFSKFRGARHLRAWIAVIRGVPFNFVVSKSFGRVELYIDRGDKDENKAIFDDLYSQRSSIESTFGRSLIWERLENKRASRVKSEMAGDPFDDAQRPAIMSFMIDTMIRFEKCFAEPLQQVQRKLRARSEED